MLAGIEGMYSFCSFDDLLVCLATIFESMEACGLLNQEIEYVGVPSVT